MQEPTGDQKQDTEFNVQTQLDGVHVSVPKFGPTASAEALQRTLCHLMSLVIWLAFENLCAVFMLTPKVIHLLSQAP